MSEAIAKFITFLLVIVILCGCIIGVGWVNTQNHTDQDTGTVTALKETADQEGVPHFFVFVQTENHGVERFEVSIDRYNQMQIRDRITIEYKVNRFLGVQSKGMNPKYE